MARPALIATLAGLACAPATASGPSSASHVRNGGFESVVAGTPTSWSLGPQKGPASAMPDRIHHREGAGSLRLENAGAGLVTVSSEPFSVEPGETLLLTLTCRAEGMAIDGRYAGAWARIDVVWSAPSGELSSDGIRVPYQNFDWERMLRMVEVPDEATTGVVRATLSGDATAPRTRVWIDDVRVRNWTTRPASNGEERVWYAGDPDVDRARTGFRPVADEDAIKGRSVIANPQHHRGDRTMFKVTVADLPPGAYQALFRLRSGPGTAAEIAATADVFLGNPRFTLPLSGRSLPAGDPSYRLVPVPFLTTDAGEKVTLRVHWPGKVPVWVDSITVRQDRLVEERAFADLL